MAAKTPKQRQQDKRDRDKMSKEEREARLLSRRIVTDLYHNDDAALKRVMARADIGEEQDILSRLIRGADRMSDEQLADHIRIA
jgi:hypothetical protein